MVIFADIPLLWIAPSAVLALLLSWLYYRYQKSTSDFSFRLKWILVLLRAMSLFLLLILLLGIVLQRSQYRNEKPIILGLVDDSQSMLNYADSNDVLPAILGLKSDLQSKFMEKGEVLFMDLDMNAWSEETGFKRPISNLADAIADVGEQFGNRNLGAVILISDGNFNRGKNPVYVVDNLGFTPIYSLGIGDTIQKKDLVVSNVTFNDIAFLGNTFPLVVTAECFEAPNEKVKIEVVDRGKVIAEKQVFTSSEGYSLFQETFLIDADRVGYKELVVRIVPIQGESNYINNERSIFIEVIDSRSKILLLSAAPHPDLGAIRNTLVKDKNSEVSVKRIADISGESLKSYDLIVWHEPGVDFSSKILEEIERHNIPTWFILGPRTNASVIARLPLGVEARLGRQTDDVQAGVNATFRLFELSQEARQLAERFPPLTISFGTLALNKSSDILFYQKVGPVVKKEPLMLFMSHENRKFGVTFGEGLWRWRINNYVRSNDHKVFDEIVQKTVQYLLLRANTSQLRVSLPKVFNEGEKVVFGASFYNESLEPITAVDIQLKLRNSAGEELDYTFVPQAPTYMLDAGEIPAGAYEWFASTEFEGKKFEKQGGFVVRSLAIERLDTRSNFSLLNQLAENSGGQFHRLSEYRTMLQALENQEDLVTISFASTGYKKLIDYKWWFALIVVLLFTEWFIRRYNGAY